MEREQLDRLLAEYATGGLSEEEKKQLFTAALSDQELFDQLMAEDELREAIELPGARNRLIDSLQEELVEMQPARMASVAAAPAPVLLPKAAPKPPVRQSMWLAWAAGIGVVFVSGAITYMMIDGTTLRELAQVRSEAPKETKPFVPPPAAAVGKPAAPAIVEEAPKIVAEGRVSPAPPPVVNIPLPSTPPPPLVVPAAPPAERRVAETVAVSREEKVADAVLSARQERDRSQQSEFRAPAPQQQPGAVASGPPPPAPRRQAAVAAPAAAPIADSMAKVVAPEKEMAKKPSAEASVWRRTGDGVWVRLPAGDSVGRGETVTVRYRPEVTAAVVLRDEQGRTVARRDGRAGEEIELPIPRAQLERAAGGTLALTVVEEPRVARTAGTVSGLGAGSGGRANTVAPAGLKILLPVR